MCLQSLTEGVDLEDLGMHCLDKAALEHTDISLPKDTVFPAWLRDYNKVYKQYPVQLLACMQSQLTLLKAEHQQLFVQSFMSMHGSTLAVWHSLQLLLMLAWLLQACSNLSTCLCQIHCYDCCSC